MFTFWREEMVLFEFWRQMENFFAPQRIGAPIGKKEFETICFVLMLPMMSTHSRSFVKGSLDDSFSIFFTNRDYIY